MSAFSLNQFLHSFVHLKVLDLMSAFQESANWALLSSFCDCSNLHISVFKSLVSTKVTVLKPSANIFKEIDFT